MKRQRFGEGVSDEGRGGRARFGTGRRDERSTRGTTSARGRREGGIDDETTTGIDTTRGTKTIDTVTDTAIDRRRGRGSIGTESIAIEETTGTANRRRRAIIIAGVRRRDIATTTHTVEEAEETGTMGTAIEIAGVRSLASASVRPLANDDGRRSRLAGA